MSIALRRQLSVGAKKESAYNTPAIPAGTDMFRVLDASFPPLQNNFAADGQQRDFRDVFHRYKGKIQAGSFSLTVDAKPSGLDATAPASANMFEAALGAFPAVLPSGLTCLAGSTASALQITGGVLSAASVGMMVLVEGQVAMISSINVGTTVIGITPPLAAAPQVGAAIGRSVNYRLAETPPSLTFLVRDGHSMFLNSGAVIDTMQMKVTGTDIATFTFGGPFAKQVITGTDAVGAAGVASGVTTVFPVADCSKFEVGSRFNCESETNIEVTFVPALTGPGNLTVVRGSGAAAHAAAAAITPYVPATSEVGAPVHGKLGKLSIGGAAVTFTSLDLNLKNSLKLLDTEAGSDYATDFIPGMREITGTVKVFFRADDLDHFRNARAQVPVSILAQAGNAAGSIVAVVMQNAELDLPAITGNDQRELDIKFTAFGVNGNDALSLAFL